MTAQIKSYNNAKSYSSGVGIKTDLINRFKEINEHDREMLFGSKRENDLFTAVKKGETDEDSIEAILSWYENEYVVPFWTGYILRDIDGDDWIVTCVYTDGSIDLISANGPVVRENTGTIGLQLIKVGELELILENDNFNKANKEEK